MAALRGDIDAGSVGGQRDQGRRPRAYQLAREGRAVELSRRGPRPGGGRRGPRAAGDAPEPRIRGGDGRRDRQRTPRSRTPKTNSPGGPGSRYRRPCCFAPRPCSRRARPGREPRSSTPSSPGTPTWPRPGTSGAWPGSAWPGTRRERGPTFARASRAIPAISRPTGSWRSSPRPRGAMRRPGRSGRRSTSWTRPTPPPSPTSPIGTSTTGNRGGVALPSTPGRSKARRSRRPFQPGPGRAAGGAPRRGGGTLQGLPEACSGGRDRGRGAEAPGGKLTPVADCTHGGTARRVRHSPDRTGRRARSPCAGPGFTIDGSGSILRHEA